MSLVKRISWAASLSVLVGVTVVGGVASWLSIGSLDRHAQAALDIVSTGSAARIGEWIAVNERLVSSMAPETADSPASLADAGGKDDARLMHVLEVARQAGGFRQTFIGIAGDRRYLRMPPGTMPAGYDPTGRPWFKQAVSEDKLVIPMPYFDAVDHDLVMTFALPVKHDGKVFGVMGGFNSLDTVQKIVDETKPTPHSYATVIDSQDRILIHPIAGNALKPATEVLPWFKAGLATHGVIPIDDRGRASWVRFVDIPGTTWRMAVVLDRADVQSDMVQLVGSIAVTGAAVAAIVALMLASYLKRSFASLRKVGEAIADIAQGQGDLNVHIDVSGNDEVGRIGAAFNAFSDKLRMLVKDVQGASSQVEAAARDIASGNQDLASRTEKQASMIQECAHSMFQITDASNNSLANAAEANRIAQQTAELAAAGGAKMTNFVATMDEIRESSQKINDIIAVIDGLAFQTNILALNAAVEAARAGVQGRGFAVVAAEVRTLAQRSAAAAHDIRTLIVHSTARVEVGTARLDDASRSISSVVTSIHSLSRLMSGIFDATQSQRHGVEDVKESFVRIDLMTQQNAALVEEAAAAAESLRDQSELLAQTVELFRT